MSAVAVQMEVEEGANATVTDLITAMVGEEELGLPRNTQVQHLLLNVLVLIASAKSLKYCGLVKFGM
jgi:hypothetical protein